MANRFWVGGTGTWNLSNTTNWAATSGGAGGVSVPTAADDVFLDGNSGTGTVTVSAAASLAVCRSLTCTGYAGTLNFANLANCLTIGDASGGAMVLVAGMTVGINGANSSINFVSTSSNGGTGWGVTTAGKTMPAITFNGAGGMWVLQDAFTSGGASSGTLSVSAGSFFGNGKTITCNVFNSTSSTTRTVDITNCSVNVAGSNGNVFNLNNAGLTFTATGSTVTLSGASANIATNTLAYSFGTVIFSGSGSPALNTSSLGTTFANLTRTGTATKTDGFTLTNVITVTGTLTLGGNTTQGVNRLLVQSNTPGTQRVITATGAAVVISGDVDFVDIGITGTPSWTNTGSKFVGDCGGNGVLITANRTTPTTIYWVGANNSGNWSDTTKWSTSSGGAGGARVPLPQDSVRFDANSVTTTSRTITYDMPRLGGDIDYTGVLNSPTLQYNLGATTFGSYTLVAGLGQSGGTGLTFAGRGTHTFTSAGYSFPQGLVFSGPGGTYTLQDSLTTVGSLTISDGTWTTNSNAVACTFFAAVSGRTTVLNLGTSVFTASTTTGGASVFNDANGATTSNGTPSIIVASAASSTTNRTVNKKGGTTLTAITYTVANSPGGLTIDTNTASTLTITTLTIGSGRGLTFGASKTYVITNFNVNGVANGYLYIPPTNGHFASTADYAAARITGDIDIRIRMNPDNWVPPTRYTLVAKYNNTGAFRSYDFALTSTGILQLLLSADGTNTASAISTVAPPGVAGTPLWLRVTWRQSDGRVQFFTADGSLANPSAGDFSQLGANASAAIASIFSNTTAGVSVGNLANGASAEQATGNFYRAQIRDGIDGTVVFDADFTTHNVGSSNWLDAAKTQFAEGSSNAATVTINGTLAQAGDGRVVLNSNSAGTRANLSKPSGIVSVNYLSIKDSAADGGASWHALNSADAGNNTGWIFSSAPSTSTNFLIFGGRE